MALSAGDDRYIAVWRNHMTIIQLRMRREGGGEEGRYTPSLNRRNHLFSAICTRNVVSCTLQNYLHETTFLIQIVLKRWFLLFEFGV